MVELHHDRFFFLCAFNLGIFDVQQLPGPQKHFFFLLFRFDTGYFVICPDISPHIIRVSISHLTLKNELLKNGHVYFFVVVVVVVETCSTTTFIHIDIRSAIDKYFVAIINWLIGWMVFDLVAIVTEQLVICVVGLNGVQFTIATDTNVGFFFLIKNVGCLF